MTSYSDLVKLVAEVERYAPETEVATIELVEQPADGERRVPGRSWAELRSTAERLEGRKAARESQAASAVRAAHLELSGVAQGTASRGAFASAAGQGLSPESDIGQLASGIAAIIPKMKVKVKRINVKELVLPNLSVSDQISELERIAQGLQDEVFDAEHIEVVALELYGLEQYIKTIGRSRKAPATDLERSLWEIRDQRLFEAISLLQKQAGAAE